MNNKIRKELEGLVVRIEEIKENEEQKLDNLEGYFPDTRKTELQAQVIEYLDDAIQILNNIIVLG